MNSISQWCGRFGNNIQQISNAIFYCKENGLTFVSPDNELINPFGVKFGESYAPPRLYFFHIPSSIGNGRPDFIADVDKLTKERRMICKDIIYNFLKIDFNNINDLGDDTVVLQVRSGDIFSRKNYYCPVVSNYLQNPLSYYTNIIKDYKNVIVITEDYDNPVISELEKIDNVEVRILPTDKSIELILSTRNLVTSGVSSFGIACALLSRNIKRLYCSNLYLDEVLNYKNLIDTDVEVILSDINQERYIKWNEWLNTDEQREIMINYEDTNL